MTLKASKQGEASPQVPFLSPSTTPTKIGTFIILRQRHGSVVVVLGREDEGKAALLVAVTPDLQARIHAGQLVRRLARIVDGGGGGRPDLAEAGGKDPGRLDEALSEATLAREIQEGA